MWHCCIPETALKVQVDYNSVCSSFVTAWHLLEFFKPFLLALLKVVSSSKCPICNNILHTAHLHHTAVGLAEIRQEG